MSQHTKWFSHKVAKLLFWGLLLWVIYLFSSAYHMIQKRELLTEIHLLSTQIENYRSKNMHLQIELYKDQQKKIDAFHGSSLSRKYQQVPLEKIPIIKF